jgi:hypothetical protein
MVVQPLSPGQLHITSYSDAASTTLLHVVRYSVLSLLSTRLGTFLLVGIQCFTRKPPFVTAFWNLPLRRIESILLHWLNNRISILRLLGRGLKGLCLQALVSMPGAHMLRQDMPVTRSQDNPGRKRV